MGRCIIEFTDGHLESFKCKSGTRANEIAAKRNKVRHVHYFEGRVWLPKKRKEKLKGYWENWREG